MSQASDSRPAGLRVVMVSGMSGAGKSSILRTLEDLGYEAVDNAPLALIDELVAQPERRLAVGVDARTRGFDAGTLLDTLERMRLNPQLRPELLYAWADEDVLLRRYTETRRRHPMAPQGRVSDGIAAEAAATAALRHAADLVLDTSTMPPADLRRLIERHFSADDASPACMVISLISFAFPYGLPREADIVLDARFLRNPHYDPQLRPHTGRDPRVSAYIEADADFATFFGQITAMFALLLPRFVQEGKKYATIAIGCTGGRHRSVHTIEKLAWHLRDAGYCLHVTHRELAREADATRSGGDAATQGERPGPRDWSTERQTARSSPPVQAQEA